MSKDIIKGPEGEDTEESTDMPELIYTDISELATILSENPEIEQQVRGIIDYHLKGDVDNTTYEKIYTGLEMLLDEGAARIILSSCKFNDNNFFEAFVGEIEGLDVDKSLPFLRHLTALYGSKIEEAYALFGEIPEDWRRGNVFYHKKEEVEFIDVNLIKYNGNVIFLRMHPESAFNLARILIMEMEKLQKEAVDEKVIKVFREGTEGFRNKFLSDNDNRD